MFTSILNTAETASFTTQEILICTMASVLLGIVISVIYKIIGEGSKSYRTALVILPVLVQGVIMLVNGNLGASVAVLGAFSLIRFRSSPGNSKEICGIFFAMAIGLATAMGCIGFGCLITVIVGGVLIVMTKVHLGIWEDEKVLRITIPENLDYTNVFDDIFKKYTDKNELERVKTTNLGSMFELTYKVAVKKDINEKKLIDEIRCRNGNLTVMCSKPEHNPAEL